MFNATGKRRRENGFTLIEVLIAMAIIGILAAVAIPQFTQYKQKAYDSNSQLDLHNLYLACKAYWGNNDSSTACAVSNATASTYGYIQSGYVSVNITTMTEDSFQAEAQHSAGTTPYTIDQNGNIS